MALKKNRTIVKIVCVMEAGKANAKHALAGRRMVTMLEGDRSLYLYLHAMPQIAQLSQRVGSWVPCDLAHLGVGEAPSR
jgi:hypothetical protein